MELGNNLHEIFYNLIRSHGEDAGVKYFPEEWATKKECGISKEDQKKNFIEAAAMEKKIVLSPKHKEIVDSIRLHYGLINDVKKLSLNRNIKFEVAAEDDQTHLCGIADILTESKIIDIKTSSKIQRPKEDFAKWNEKRLAMQQIVYDHLFPGREFLLLVVETAWPFSVFPYKPDDHYVEICKALFWDKIQPEWEICQDAIKQARTAYKKDEEINKEEAWSFFSSKGIVNFNHVHEGQVSNWTKKEAEQERSRYLYERDKQNVEQ